MKTTYTILAVLAFSLACLAQAPTIQKILIGSRENDPAADTVRAGFSKVNSDLTAITNAYRNLKPGANVVFVTNANGSVSITSISSNLVNPVFNTYTSTNQISGGTNVVLVTNGAVVQINVSNSAIGGIQMSNGTGTNITLYGSNVVAGMNITNASASNMTAGTVAVTTLTAPAGVTVSSGTVTAPLVSSATITNTGSVNTLNLSALGAEVTRMTNSRTVTSNLTVRGPQTNYTETLTLVTRNPSQLSTPTLRFSQVTNENYSITNTWDLFATIQANADIGSNWFAIQAYGGGGTIFGSNGTIIPLAGAGNVPRVGSTNYRYAEGWISNLVISGGLTNTGTTLLSNMVTIDTTNLVLSNIGGAITSGQVLTIGTNGRVYAADAIGGAGTVTGITNGTIQLQGIVNISNNLMRLSGGQGIGNQPRFANGSSTSALNGNGASNSLFWRAGNGAPSATATPLVLSNDALLPFTPSSTNNLDLGSPSFFNGVWRRIYLTNATFNVTNVYRSNNVATNMTDFPHNFLVGSRVSITNMTDASYNATNVTILTTDSLLTFSYTNAGTNAGAASSNVQGQIIGYDTIYTNGVPLNLAGFVPTLGGASTNLVTTNTLLNYARFTNPSDGSYNYTVNNSSASYSVGVADNGYVWTVFDTNTLYTLTPDGNGWGITTNGNFVPAFGSVATIGSLSRKVKTMWVTEITNNIGGLTVGGNQTNTGNLTFTGAGSTISGVSNLTATNLTMVSNSTLTTSGSFTNIINTNTGTVNALAWNLLNSGVLQSNVLTLSNSGGIKLGAQPTVGNVTLPPAGGLRINSASAGNSAYVDLMFADSRGFYLNNNGVAWITGPSGTTYWTLGGAIGSFPAGYFLSFGTATGTGDAGFRRSAAGIMEVTNNLVAIGTITATNGVATPLQTLTSTSTNFITAGQTNFTTGTGIKTIFTRAATNNMVVLINYVEPVGGLTGSLTWGNVSNGMSFDVSSRSALAALNTTETNLFNWFIVRAPQ